MKILTSTEEDSCNGLRPKGSRGPFIFEKVSFTLQADPLGGRPFIAATQFPELEERTMSIVLAPMQENTCRSTGATRIDDKVE